MCVCQPHAMCHLYPVVVWIQCRATSNAFVHCSSFIFGFLCVCYVSIEYIWSFGIQYLCMLRFDQRLLKPSILVSRPIILGLVAEPRHSVGRRATILPSWLQSRGNIDRNDFRREGSGVQLCRELVHIPRHTKIPMASTQLLPGCNDNHHHPAASNDTRHSDSNELSSPSQDSTHCGAHSSAVHVTTGAVGVVPSGGPCLMTAYGTVVWPALPGVRSATELAATPARAPGDPPSSVTADHGECYRGGECHQGPPGTMGSEESLEECGETLVSSLLCVSVVNGANLFCDLHMKNSGTVLNDRRRLVHYCTVNIKICTRTHYSYCMS